MRTIHKIGIGVLVGLFFASGYAARIHCSVQQRAAVVKRFDASAEGTRVASARLTDVANVDIRPLETLRSVLRSLREHYVEQLTVEEEGKMTYDAMRWMLASLSDPDTRFIEPAQRKLLADAEQGRFHGIGAIMAIRQTFRDNKEKPKEPISEEHLIVATLLPDGPAAKAGLKAGDEIVTINGKDVLPFNPYQRVNDMFASEKTKSLTDSQKRKLLDAEQKRIDDGVGVIEAERLLMSDDKKPIELKLAAKSAKTITIQPAEVTVDPVSAVRMENGDMGYVRVGFFGKDTAAKFAEAMKEVEAKDAKGLIVDLRGSTGGSVESAEKIASWFAPQKIMAVLLKSRGRKDLIRIPAPEGRTWQKPVVLLVDGSTTRAPEVLAAALKDSGTAKLVGEKTYGDFSDSTLIDLADGSAVVIATGKYVTGKGADYNRKGLPVDVQASTSDLQIKEAVRLLSGSGGRS